MQTTWTESILSAALFSVTVGGLGHRTAKSKKIRQTVVFLSNASDSPIPWEGERSFGPCTSSHVPTSLVTFCEDDYLPCIWVNASAC
jgi:hypothetical protein